MNKDDRKICPMMSNRSSLADDAKQGYVDEITYCFEEFSMMVNVA